MSSERVKQYRLRQKELGRLKREFYLTEEEFESIKIAISEIRGTLYSPRRELKGE